LALSHEAKHLLNGRGIEPLIARRMRNPGWIAVAIFIFSSLGLSMSSYEVVPDGSKRAMYATTEDDQYKSPIQLAISKDGTRLFVACENSNEVLIIDVRHSQVIANIKVGRHPFGVTLSPDEAKLYVSNRWDNSLTVIDLASFKVVQTALIGDDPHQMRTDASGKLLYVSNLTTNDISVVDTATMKETKRLVAGMSPFGMCLSPDARFLYATNQLSSPVPFRTAPVTELTVVDTASQLVTGRRRLVSTVIAQDVAVSPDGEFVVVAVEMPKNLLPETQVYQGWMVTHGFAVVEAGPRGRAAYFLLDEMNRYFADAYGVAFSPDGHRLYVSSSGVDFVSVINMDKVYALLDVRNGKIGIPDETIKLYARHLTLSSEYVEARVPTGSNPKDIVLSPDGKRLYVADRLSDSILVVDTESNKPSGTIDLGGPRVETELRKGEKLFNYSTISFQRQLSCNTCHPEYHLDGLVYDIVAPSDPMGQNLVDNRTMRGIAYTGPFKWNGKNPSLARQDGPRAAQLFFRSHGFDPTQLTQIVKFVESLVIQPNRFLANDGVFTDQQEEGRILFGRAFVKAGPLAGRYIPVGNRCVSCHMPPYYTDHHVHNVGTQAYTDAEDVVDTPQLGNVYENAPFLHDGRCYSLEEIWTVHNPDDMHGSTNGSMDKRELNSLIEYLKTLTARDPMSDKEFLETTFPKSTEKPSVFRLEGLENPIKSELRYLGNKVCAECHVNEYKAWLGSGHARTWVMLGLSNAASVGKQLEIGNSNPQYNIKCLMCHGTAAEVTAESRASNFHIEEGVKCESCHGPGEEHTSFMRRNPKGPMGRLKMPNLEDCLTCHKPKPSHVQLNKAPFDIESDMRKISHWKEKKMPH
jgi:YVTN family beta-propeller protein